MGKRITAGLIGLCMMVMSILAGLAPGVAAYAAGTTLIVHYGGRSDGNYDGWNLWIWEEGKDGQQVDFTGSDSFGQVAVYQSNNAPAKIGFIVRLNEWVQKDVDEDRFVTMDQDVVEIWVTSGQAEFATEAPEGAEAYDFASVEEARMKLYEEEDAIKLNVHYYNFEESYSSDTLEAFAWEGEEAGGAYPYVETDAFGAVFHVGLKPEEGVDTAGLRILQNGADDAISARKVDLSKAQDNTLDVYTVEGNPTVWYSKEEVNYRPVIADAYFGEKSSKQIIFTLSRPIDTADETEGSRFKVTDAQGMSYPIVKVWSEDPKVEKTAYLIMKEPLDLSKSYTIVREDYEGCQVSMRKVIGTTYFDEAFAYDGDDLGAVYTKESTKFRVWAPTADEVALNLYEEGDGDNLLETIPMEADEKGTWICEKQGNLNGRYYTYSIRINDTVNEAVDLYARSTGVNGNRGMILDLPRDRPGRI